MKRKFFLRRAAVFFITMLIPTLVLFALFLGISVNNANIHLVDKGVQTIRAVQDSCEIMLNRTAQQNDLLTGTTRMNVSLKRALHQTEMTYGDSVFLTALGSMVRSTVDSNLPLARIMIWLDGAGRIFSSDGSSIQPLEQLADQEWRLAYGQMSDSERELLTLTTRADGRAMLTSIRRLLLQKGCTVVDIDVEIWKEKLLTLLQRSDEHLFLIREDGQLLLHVTNTSVPCAWAQDAALLQTLQHSEAGRWLATDYGHFLVSKAQMDQLCLLSVVPQKAMYDTFRVMQQYFLGILIVNICVVMLLAYLTTRRICNQMTLMIDMLDDALKGLPVVKPKRKVHDEYDVIMNNILYMYLRDNALRAELQQKQYEQEHAELMALQLQINPHFLYNTLQSLDVTIRGGMADRFDLCDIIRSISDILKYALSSPQEPVSLHDEIHHLKEYAAVQKFRFGGRFVLYYDVDEQLLDAQVFRLMLQPLVENSMLHGLNGLSERGYIWVRVQREDDLLCISVKDSGAGMQPDELTALRQRIQDGGGRSIGLNNLNRRLLLRYGEASALHIQSAPGEGMEIRFSLPYEPMPSAVSFDVIENNK